MPVLSLPVKLAAAAAAVGAVALLPRPAGPQPPPAHAQLAAAVSADATMGSVCSVPGVGDIGGLLGFCHLGSSGIAGDLNNICKPAPPEPEPAAGGIDSMVAPPRAGQNAAAGTLYDEYGVAGNYWAATNLQCSDMASMAGNDVAGMVFDAAKSVDRVTITVYQAAAGNGIVSWLQHTADALISGVGRAVYFPYLAAVVILGAMWLAWQGLFRQRATRTIEGTVWMIVACAAAIFLIGAPSEVTGAGAAVTDGISAALNTAFASLPGPGPSSCVPVQPGDPQARAASYAYTSGGTVVDQDADELWTLLVCKPWLVGEFGTSAYTAPGRGRATAVNTYGRSLLWAQSIAADESATPGLIKAKQAAFAGIAASMQSKDPASYPLFQGKEWTTRLEVAFAALFAALVAGVLLLLMAVSLILLKLGFLLLLIVGPAFLLVGTHPGFGRIVAVRWAELLVGVLLKQAAVALVLSLLLYCYALIIGTSDAQLPWALKVLMIALVTVAAFIYRKPFQHLFAAAGSGLAGSPERAEAGVSRASDRARANTLAAAGLLTGAAAFGRPRPAGGSTGRARPAAAGGRRRGRLASLAAGLAMGGSADPDAQKSSVTEDPEVAQDRRVVRRGLKILRRQGRGAGGAAPAGGKPAGASGQASGEGGPPPLNLASRDDSESGTGGRKAAGGGTPAGSSPGRAAGGRARSRAAGRAGRRARDPGTAAGRPAAAAPPRQQGTQPPAGMPRPPFRPQTPPEAAVRDWLRRRR